MMEVVANLAGRSIDKGNNNIPAIEAPKKEHSFNVIDGIDHLFLEGEEREVFMCDVEDRLWYVDDEGDECWVD